MAAFPKRRTVRCDSWQQPEWVVGSHFRNLKVTDIESFAGLAAKAATASLGIPVAVNTAPVQSARSSAFEGGCRRPLRCIGSR